MKRKKPSITTSPPTTYPSATYPSAMSGPVAIDGVIYFVCAVPYPQFLDWRYSPLGHAEIDRVLRTCQSIKIWFPKSDNLIATLTRHNVGTIQTSDPHSPLPS